MLLIETAGEALSILSDDASNDEHNTDQFVHDRAEAFRGLAQKYFSLVNVSSLFHSIEKRESNDLPTIGHSICSKKSYTLLDKRSKYHIKKFYTIQNISGRIL